MTEAFNKKIAEIKEQYFKDADTKDKYTEAYSMYIFTKYKFLKMPQQKLMNLIAEYSEKYPTPTDENIKEISEKIEEILNKHKCVKKGFEVDGYEFLVATYIYAFETANEQK